MNPTSGRKNWSTRPWDGKVRIGRDRARILAFFVGATVLLLPLAPVRAASNPDAAVSIPLPPIPHPSPHRLGTPDAQERKELQRLLDQLASVKPKDQRAAAEALAEQDESILPAIAAKLAALRKSADREGMRRILEEARKAARQDEKNKKRRSKPKRKVPFSEEGTPRKRLPLIDEQQTDWLRYVLQAPMPKKQAYRDLVAVLALARTCASLGTTAAAREIINVYMYFGEMFRIDVQRQLARMGERAIPALVEAQYHDSRMVRTWAKRQLDLMGKAIPSEAVRLADSEALADVLRAYGKAREVEAVRVIVSFCNSDRRQVRLAAREAIGQIGAPARWQLRDAYKRLMGKAPPRSWDWRRTARELFAFYDRARLEPVYRAMEQGLSLAKNKEYEKAAEKFDIVLARAPMFTRRSEMVPTYLELGKQQLDSHPEQAEQWLRRAVILDPNGPHANAARSLLELAEARKLSKRGITDIALVEHALQLDPSNERAKDLLEQFRGREQGKQSPWKRYAAAFAIGVAAFAAMLGIALFRRKEETLQTEQTPDRPRRSPLPDEPPPSSH